MLRDGDRDLPGAPTQMPPVRRKDMFYQSESLLFEFLVRSLIASKNQHREVNNDSGFILVLFPFLHFFFNLLITLSGQNLGSSRCNEMCVGELLPLDPSRGNIFLRQLKLILL